MLQNMFQDIIMLSKCCATFTDLNFFIFPCCATCFYVSTCWITFWWHATNAATCCLNMLLQQFRPYRNMFHLENQAAIVKCMSKEKIISAVEKTWFCFPASLLLGTSWNLYQSTKLKELVRYLKFEFFPPVLDETAVPSMKPPLKY